MHPTLCLVAVVLLQLPARGAAAALPDFWELAHRRPKSNGGAQQKSRESFRDALFALQNPEDCEAATLCSCSHPTNAGMFSLLHGRIDCLLETFINNCTFVDDSAMAGEMVKTHTYVNQAECDPAQLSTPWECYFRPVSKCSTPGAVVSKTFSINQECEADYLRLNAVKARFGLSSRLMLNSELLTYIMRANDRLADSVKRWSHKLGLTNVNQFSRCLAVHIRHSDKRGVPVEEKAHTTFVGAAKHLSELYGQDIINYMTDDPRVAEIFDTMPQLDPSLTVTTLPAPVGRHVKGEHQADAGLLLLTHVILLAQCDMLLGSQVSNVDRAILELMSAVSWPPSSVDMYGDLYAPCKSGEKHTDFAGDSTPFYEWLAQHRKV